MFHLGIKNQLKSKMKDEDNYTVPLDDTGALGSPEAEALLEPLNINTEVLDIPDSVGYETNAMDHSIKGMVDDFVTDIVLDGDEGETEVGGSALPVKEKKRNYRGYGSSMEKRKLNALGNIRLFISVPSSLMCIQQM